MARDRKSVPSSGSFVDYLLTPALPRGRQGLPGYWPQQIAPDRIADFTTSR